MKSFFALSLLMFTVSVACTAYKSAGSQSLPNSNATNTQTSTGQVDPVAQEKPTCALTMTGAPDVNGIRLGMTPDEVLALFPGSKDDADVRNYLSRPPSQFGVSELAIKPARFESKEKFAGINQITFALLDGRVSTFTVNYGGPEYPHVDKFVAKFIEGKNLPAADQWEAYVGMDNQLKTLKCTDFEIRIFAGGPGGNLNYVLMRDLEADKKLKDRRKKARESATPSP